MGLWAYSRSGGLIIWGIGSFHDYGRKAMTFWCNSDAFWQKCTVGLAVLA